MLQASGEMKFEEAAQYRDLMQSVEKIGERQKITDHPGEDKDIIAAAMENDDAVVQVFFVRDGKLIGRDHFYMKTAPGENRRGILSSFLKQFYAGTPFIPREIMLQEEIEDRELLEEWLESRKGRKVRITVPKKEPRKNWWNWLTRMQSWCSGRIRNEYSGKREERLGRSKRLRSC